MVNVGSFDAKTHLPSLLERVIKGEIIQITRRGVPIAKIVPVDVGKRVGYSEAAKRIREIRKGMRMDGVNIKELIHEGHRF